MADDKVSIPIDADTEPAQKAFDNFAKETDKTFKKVEKSVSGLGESFKGMAIKIGAAVASFAAIKKAIDEAVSEEKSIRSLNLALAGTGEYSAEAASSMEDFAQSLGNVTGLGDDAVRTALTLAKSFGITNDQARQLVDAAADLSAVTGDDLDTAVRQLGGTFDGTIGKIGNLGADFRNLTADQLKNGDAITLLNKRYGDAAESLGETFGASLSRLQNAFDDSFKEIGKAIIKDSNVKEALNGFATGLNAIAPVIAQFAGYAIKVFSMVGEGLSELAKVALFYGSTLAEAVGADDIAVELQKAAVGFDNFSQSIKASRTDVQKLDESSKSFSVTLEKVNKNASKPLGLSGKALEEVNKKAEDAAKSFADFKSKLNNSLFTDEIQKIDAKYSNEQRLFLELVKEKKLTESQRVEGLEALEKAKANEISEYQKKKNKENADDARNRIEKIATNPVTLFFDSKEASFTDAGVGFAGAFDKALSGKSGAVQMVSSLAGEFANTILPGIGGVVGSIIGKLAAGPEQAKAFVKEFISAIPDIIVAIVDALPEALSAIVEKVFSPEFLQRLGFALGKAMLFYFTYGLSAFAPEWGRKIGEYILVPLSEGLKPIFERLAVIFEPFNAAADKLKLALEPVSNVMNKLADALNNFKPPSLGGA